MFIVKVEFFMERKNFIYKIKKVLAFVGKMFYNYICNRKREIFITNESLGVLNLNFE